MLIKNLRVNHVRVIEQAKLSLSNHLNIITGANGSGKTSLLESLYILSTGRSFRTQQIKNVISDNAEELMIFAELINGDKAAIQRSSKGDFQVRVNQQTVKTLSTLSRKLPITVINPESYALLTSGPSQRRQYLDFSVFHVEHQYGTIYQNYQRVLKQRNASLKLADDYSVVSTWDKQLIQFGVQITQLRQREFSLLSEHIRQIQSTFLPQYEVQYSLSNGWHGDTEEEFLSNLQTQFSSDKRYGSTQSGPHRADIILSIDGRPASEVLSRGESKMMVIALLVAQINRITQDNHQPAMLLLDDISSELDASKLGMLLSYLKNIQNLQMLITAIDYDDIGSLIENQLVNEFSMFHVEHGQVTPA